MKSPNPAVNTALPAAQLTGRKGAAVMLSNTIERLRAMKMSAFADELERQLEDSSSYNLLGFEDRLSLLVDSEWNRRQNNKLLRCIRNARFSDASATIEGIEYIEDRHLDKGRMLRFATCRYVDEGRHIILKGASGNGKTYWDSANTASQGLYAVLGAHLLADMGTVSVNFWGRNLTDTRYCPFAVYSESTGGFIGQRGNPIQMGIDLRMHF